MQKKSIVAKLTETGLSEYEAKAYLALVRKNPSTAYEIAKESSIPTSKIYEVLAKLLEKTMILMVEENGKVKRYIPINPEEFLSRFQTSIADIVKSLSMELTTLKGKQELSYIWNIVEYEHLMNKAERMIKEARNVILVSIWNEELELLEASLRSAEQREVKIALVHFGLPKIQVGQFYYHPIEDTLYAEKGGRGFVLVVDSRQVLMGNIGHDGRTEGAWSQNLGFATIAEDYVKHDIYITKIIKRFEKDLIQRFGEKYALLRDVLKDEELVLESPIR